MISIVGRVFKLVEKVQNIGRQLATGKSMGGGGGRF